MVIFLILLFLHLLVMMAELFLTTVLVTLKYSLYWNGSIDNYFFPFIYHFFRTMNNKCHTKFHRQSMKCFLIDYESMSFYILCVSIQYSYIKILLCLAVSPPFELALISFWYESLIISLLLVLPKYTSQSCIFSVSYLESVISPKWLVHF